MPRRIQSTDELREYRNTRLYRSLGRILRIYNRWLVAQLVERGFHDFSPAYPALLSNLDTEGTRVGVLAARAGVTRQAAGQLLAEIESRGYVELTPDPDDARATLVKFSPRGRKMLAAVLELVEEFEGGFEHALPRGDFERILRGLARIADDLDPDGALGQGDRVPG